VGQCGQCRRQFRAACGRGRRIGNARQELLINRSA
jgi:hypothetical protein